MATSIDLKNKLLQIQTEKNTKITPQNLKSGVTAFGVTGQVEELNAQTKSVTPTTTAQTITPDVGYNGISQVDVAAVDNTIDNNIQASNIKSGVTILGIEGTVIENEDLSTQLAAQEQLIRDLQTEVNGKAGLVVNYAPSYISFRDFTGSSLNYEVANLDTSNVTSMSNMFYKCSSLTSLDVSNFDTSKVTNMNNMFYNCTSLTSLDVSNFDTSNVTDMGGMFNSCTSLTTLDLSSFNISKVTSGGYMFKDVPANCTIYVKDQATVDLLTSWDNTHTYTIKP